MTTTTTIRLEDSLKRRIAAAAERAGQTAHAFILDAIARTVQAEELDAALDQIADERWSNLLAAGESVPWNDAKAWLQERAGGADVRKPTPAKRAR